MPNQAQQDDAFSKALSSSLSGISELSVSVRIGGTVDSPSYKVSSNIDGVLSGAIRGILQGQIEAKRRALRDELDKVTGRQVAGVRSLLDQRKASANTRLEGYSNAVNRIMDEIKKKIAGGTIKNPF